MLKKCVKQLKSCKLSSELKEQKKGTVLRKIKGESFNKAKVIGDEI